MAACANLPADPTGETRWRGVYVGDGVRVGSLTSTTSPWRGGTRTVETFEMLFREADNHAVRLSDRVERIDGPDGRLLHLERVSASNGRETVRLTIDIVGGVAIAERKTPYDAHTLRADLPPATRLDGGEGLLAGWDPSQGEALAFDNFNTSSIEVERVVLRPLERDTTTGQWRVERSAYRNGALRSVSELAIDPDGGIARTTIDMFGAELVTRPISREEATRPIAAASFVSSVMMKSPNRISSRAAQGHIRYVFGFAGGRAFDLPQTPEQRTAAEGDRVVVDICKSCGPGLPTDPDFVAAGLKPTLWLQSTAEKLRMLAAFDSGEQLSDRRKMGILGARARSVLSNRDFTGHYSALEAVERRAGDCTEDAVLLAALARAAGIPAYVATGLVYSREQYHGVSNAFMPHNWTIAFVDGAWASFDISLEDFDATHIALSINEGEASALASAQQLSSHLEWRQMTEVRDAPPT